MRLDVEQRKNLAVEFIAFLDGALQPADLHLLHDFVAVILDDAPNGPEVPSHEHRQTAQSDEQADPMDGHGASVLLMNHRYRHALYAQRPAFLLVTV